MNLLFANLHWEYGVDRSCENMKPLQFPTGLAIIAAEIKKYRLDNLFTLDNYLTEVSDDQVYGFISDHQIDCVLLSMFLGNYQYRYIKKFINNAVSRLSQCKFIIGGPMATTIPGLILENTNGRDEQVILVIGEGEATIIDLLACMEAQDDLLRVPGISFKRNQAINTTAPRPRIQDLDSHPYPAYDLFDTPKYVDYVQETNRCWELSTSRGCYGRCVYCKLVFGKKISRRSAASMVGEMTVFHETYGVDRFNFVDDNFLNTEDHALEFYQALKHQDLFFKWRFQGRADRFGPRLAQTLVEVGLFDVSFGLESASPLILREMNKTLNIEQAKANIRLLPAELEPHASFIVGMPGESSETIEQTLNFIRETGLKHTQGGILTPFPNTPVYAWAKSKNLVADDDYYCDNLGPVYTQPYINLTSHSNDQLVEWSQMINEAGNANN